MLSDLLTKHAELGGKNMSNGEASPIPVSHHPIPTAKDYKRGYIKRFFIIHYQEKVTEVSLKWAKDNLSKLPKIYSSTSLKWYITDKSKDSIELNMKSPLAEDRNEFIVVNKRIPSLVKYLGKNWKQFKK